ncbi:MAG: aegerolysin family protein [Nostoc sp.]|uniref:aegerolysin family protein n=1 Tax=Nostoc sp. TaxID=1180 RepID=UPI002FF72F7E
MAARSFFISVRNYTGRSWKREGLGLSHGEWSNNQKSIPPEHISKLTLDRDGDAIPGTISFESESGGFATGTEGFVDYIDDKGEKLHI